MLNNYLTLDYCRMLDYEYPDPKAIIRGTVYVVNDQIEYMHFLEYYRLNKQILEKQQPRNGLTNQLSEAKEKIFNDPRLWCDDCQKWRFFDKNWLCTRCSKHILRNRISLEFLK